MTRPAAALALSVLSGLLAPAGAQPAARAFVLDAGAPALTSIDLASGRRTAALPLSGTPSWLVQGDDGRYLVALDYGPGEDKGDRGYKAAGRSSATVIDANEFKVVGRVELGFGLDSVLIGADGRLTVTCPGYDAKDPREALPRELVVVDLATARETGRLPLEPGTELTWRSRDGRALALLQGLPRPGKYPWPRSKVSIVDVARSAVTATLDAVGWDLVERDDDRLYLINRGKPDGNPQKNRNGTIDVITLAEGRVERVDIGRSPAGVFFVEGGLLAVASEGAAGGEAGELRFLREGRLAATLPVASRPRLVTQLAGAVWVVGARAVTRVDPASLQITATIPFTKGAESVVDDGDQPFEMVVTPDARRGFIHYPAQDKVAVLDLEQGKVIGSAKTGRGGKKLFNAMMSGLTYGASDRVYSYHPGSDPPQMLARPDGRFAYALNLDTSDVTVVDAETAQAVTKIGAGGRALAFLGGSTLLVLGQGLQVIDTARNVKVDPPLLPALRGLSPSPDGAFAVALAERTVVILDGATGKERARLTDFVKPTRVAFAESGPPAEPPTP
jgi:DNA-binding beta-propeller fold protein YncE